MVTLGTIAVFVGFAIIALGGIWFLINAFLESIIWGLICLFTGVGNLIFLILHWRVAKRPFFFQLLGIALVIIGGLITGEGASVFLSRFTH